MHLVMQHSVSKLARSAHEFPGTRPDAQVGVSEVAQHDAPSRLLTTLVSTRAKSPWLLQTHFSVCSRSLCQTWQGGLEEGIQGQRRSGLAEPWAEASVASGSSFGPP